MRVCVRPVRSPNSHSKSHAVLSKSCIDKFKVKDKQLQGNGVMRFFKSCSKSVNAIEDLGRAGREQVMTAFQVGNLGFYEFNHMPFGLCKTPAIFQRLMERCMGEMNQRDCLIYLDDIIFFSSKFEEHLDKRNNHLKF